LIETPALNVTTSEWRAADLIADRPQSVATVYNCHFATAVCPERSWLMEISGIVTGSGFSDADDQHISTSVTFRTGSNTLERPMRVAGQPCRASGPTAGMAKPQCLHDECFIRARSGSFGVGICHRSRYSDVDSPAENFKITERWKMPVPIDILQPVNHPHTGQRSQHDLELQTRELCRSPN